MLRESAVLSEAEILALLYTEGDGGDGQPDTEGDGKADSARPVHSLAPSGASALANPLPGAEKAVSGDLSKAEWDLLFGLGRELGQLPEEPRNRHERRGEAARQRRSDEGPHYATEDWFHGLCLAVRRWWPGEPRFLMLVAYLTFLKDIFRLKRKGMTNVAIAKALANYNLRGTLTEGDIRHHIKRGPEAVSRLARRLDELRRGIRNAISYSPIMTPRQRRFIEKLAGEMGIRVPTAWLTYSKRQAGGLIGALLKRIHAPRVFHRDATDVVL